MHSVFLCACETWTLTAELENRDQSIEMRWKRRLLNISYEDHIMNEEVKNRIEEAGDPYEDLLAAVKRCKLRWFGLITRGERLAKTVLKGTVRGGRKRERQKKRWKDNFTEWTDLKLNAAVRLVEDRGKWRDLVHRSSVAPQRQPSRDISIQIQIYPMSWIN